MFTKYNNINIPQNYSGNRFKHDITNTEMKTHRPTTTSAVKTSVSPYFQESVNNAIESLPSSDNVNIESATKEVGFGEISDTPLGEIESVRANDEESSLNVNEPMLNGASESKSTEPSNSLDTSRLTDMFKSIKSDDLLLLVLILLLAKDNTENGIDALVILALLLMYH